MNVLITSGGTVEKIDSVRAISNISTGKLGSLTAGCFAKKAIIKKIFYICSSTAVKPQSEKVEIIYVDSVSSLENAVKQVFSHTPVDIIIHAMAVSDYRVKAVSSAEIIAGTIASKLNKIGHLDNQTAAAAVASLLKEPESIIDGEGKIGSDMEDMLIFMERTPKIISLFQSLSPQSTLVGFKLLDNVPPDKLIETGFRILLQNKCSFVLANDLRDITSGQHIGYLIDRKKNYTRFSTKADIANAIVSAAISERTAAI